MMEKFINDCLAQNAAAGSSGLPPITYRKVIKFARQVLTAEGYSDSNIFAGDAYSTISSTDNKKDDKSNVRNRDGDRDGRNGRDRDNSNR